MTWKQTPTADSSWLSKPLAWFARVVIRFPWLTLFLSGVTAAGALWLTTTKLGFRTSRAELLSPNSDYNRRWLEYTKEFGDKEDVVVVVEADTEQNTIAALDDVCDGLAKRQDLFSDVLHRTDAPKLRGKGLYYLEIASEKPDEITLQKILELLHRAEPVLKSGLGGLAGQMDAAMGGGTASQQQMLAAMKTELPQMMQGLMAALAPGGKYQSPWPKMALPDALAAQATATRLISKDGRTGFILLRLLEEDTQGFAKNDASIKVLRQLNADVLARHPGTKIGLTGLPIIEYDEMNSSENSMAIASILSFVGVLLVIVVAFGGFRYGIMTMIALAIGSLWACGAVALMVGYVNVLSIAFGSILFGLGIDYGVHFVARYLELRRETESTSDALVDAMAETGPGILIAAVSSALAFFAAGFTDFPGVAQLGVIAGAGVMLCWLAEVAMLPAMIRLTDSDGKMKHLPVPLDLRVWLRPLFAYPRAALLGLAACTAVTAVGIRYVWYDYNLLNLQPTGLESVELEHKLFQQLDRSAWFAISVADSPEELLERKEQFLKLPSVDRVEEIVSKLPANCEKKRPAIEEIHRRLADLPKETPNIPVLPLADLIRMLTGVQAMTAAVSESAQMSEGLRQMCEMLQRIPPDEYQRRMHAYQQAMAADLLERMRSLEAASSPKPPTMDDLPKNAVSRFIGKNNRYAMQVYSKSNIWEVGPMGQFVREVRSVDPNATGNPMQVHEASWQMKQSFEMAAVYALMMIVVAVFLDFRRINLTLLSLLPMGVGVFQTLGLMGLLGIPLNPANMIVLPLAIGLGMDNGVNLIHEMRCQRGRYRGPGNVILVSVVVNSLTTMVGFGALMIANHQGLQSLGRVLTISVGCCLFSSLVLPSLLMVGRFGKDADEDEEDDSDDSLLQDAA